MANEKQQIRLTSLMLCFCVAATQFSPTWNPSLYLQTKTFSIISGTQQTSGSFPTTVTFGSTYPTPSLALSIPQLRIVSNSKAMGFKCSYSSLTPTSFFHMLVIHSNTVVWYLQVRYFVVSLQLLPNTFQAGIYDGSRTINSGAGNPRTEILTNATALSFSITQYPICIPFLTGVTASTTADHYQLNITCSASSPITIFELTATVHPQTTISALTVNVLLYNQTEMVEQSLYFVDYTLTTTYLGSQTVSASLPMGYFDSNFIGGMDSFSMQNNVEYNLTLAIPINNTVYTSPSSMYNSVPQVQIRVRYCPAAYPNYNIKDKLCYTICPTATYSNSTGFVCYACGAYCLTCLNSSVCTNCDSTKVLSSGICTCPMNSYLYNGICYGCHYSCQTCAATGQFYNCLSCDSTTYRIQSAITPPFECVCSQAQGFQAVEGAAVCVDICGDGKNITSECDDFNVIDGDGCSSKCTLETNFFCQKLANGTSKCYFIGNVTIKVEGIYKHQFSNKVDFYIQIQPYIGVMDTLANPLSLRSNGSFTNVFVKTYIDPDQPDVVNFIYTATFSESIQNTYIRFDLKPSTVSYANPDIFTRMPPTNLTLLCKTSNAYLLEVHSDSSYQVAISFRYVCQVFGYLMLASSPLYIFGRLKWVGNMLFLSLQFQYLNMAILDHFTPMLSGLSYFKAVMGYNQLLGVHQLDVPIYPAFHGLNYNQNFLHSVNLMVAFQGLALLMYLLYYIFWRRNELICKKYGGDPQKTFSSTRWGKFLSFFSWEFFMFWTFFNMTTQILGMILNGEVEQDVKRIPLQVFCMLCILLALLPLFVKRKQVPSYTQMLYYKDRGSEQQMVTLGAYVVMYLLFYFARVRSIVVYYAIFVPPLCLIIYMLCRRPFQSRWIRAAYLINSICLILSLIYNMVSRVYGDQIEYLPFGNFIVIVFDWIFNIVVWAREAYTICKYGGEEGLNQILQSNARTTENNEDFDNYLKAPNQLNKNNSVLDNIMKSNNKKLNNTPNRRVKKGLDPDEPEHLRKQRERMMQQENEEVMQSLKKKRQEWSKEMQEMKDIRELRERTRQGMRANPTTPKQTQRMMPTTRQKGIDQSRISNIQAQSFNFK